MPRSASNSFSVLLAAAIIASCSLGRVEALEANESSRAAAPVFVNRVGSGVGQLMLQAPLLQLPGAVTLIPMGDDDGRLDGLLRRPRGAYWRRRRRRSARRAALRPSLLPPVEPAPAAAPPPPPPPPYDGKCPAAAQPVLAALDAALLGGPDAAIQQTRFTARRGAVEWGLTEPSDDAACASAPSGCAVSNPSAPYGIVMLPLSPEESAAAKIAADSTPPYVKDSLAMAADSGGSSGDGGGDNSSSTAAAAPHAPVFQLRRDEAVVVAGCVPAAAAARYFGITGYVYAQWRRRDDSNSSNSGGGGMAATMEQPPAVAAAMKRGSGGSSSNGGSWLTAFASLGDTASVARTPGALLPAAQAAAVLRAAAADGREQQVSPPPATEAAGSAADRILINRFNVSRLFSDDMVKDSSPFDGFFVAVMGASPSTVSAASAVLARALASSGARFLPASERHAGGAAAGGARSAVSAAAAPAADAAAAAAAVINRVPVPLPMLGDTPPGLAPTSPYFMLLLRSIVGGAGPGARAAFRGYEQRAPLRAWRLTPVATTEKTAVISASDGNNDDWFPLPIVAPREPPSPASTARTSNGSGGAAAAETAQVLAPAAALAAAVAPGISSALAAGHSGGDANSSAGSAPRSSSATASEPQRLRALVSAELLAKGGLANERILQPALDFLIGRVAAAAIASGHRVAHALGAAPPFELIGIDYGLDCCKRGLDFCNGDNRDATYVTSWPLVDLSRRGQRLAVAGASHAAMGRAAYANLALTDPRARRGLDGWDDLEWGGSAAAFLDGTPWAWATPLLYVVEWAGDCSGGDDKNGGNSSSANSSSSRPYCRQLPAEAVGGGSLGAAAAAATLPAPLLLVARAYVDPATRVGPAGARLLAPHAMVLTPEGAALPRDTRPRFDARIFGGGGGGGAGAGAGAGSGRSNASSAAEPGACVAALVRASQCAPGGAWPECCAAAAGWQAAGCGCSQEGAVLLGSLPAVLTPAALDRLAAACGGSGGEEGAALAQPQARCARPATGA